MSNHKRNTLIATFFIVAIAFFVKNIGASPPPIKISGMHIIWQVEPDGSDIMQGAWLYISLGITNPTEQCPEGSGEYVIVAEVWPEIYHLESFPSSWDCAERSLYGGDEAISDLEDMLEMMIQYRLIPLSDINLVGEISGLQQLYDALHDQVDAFRSHLIYQDGYWRYTSIPEHVEQFYVFAPMVSRQGQYSDIGTPPIPQPEEVDHDQIREGQSI